MAAPHPADNAMKIGILIEDDHFLAVEKPAGIHTAPLVQGEGGTLLESIMSRYPEVKGVPGIKPEEPGLIHRLDRDTSGVVLVARTALGFERLLEQFQGETAAKTYLAVCRFRDGDPVATEIVSATRESPFRMESRFAPLGEGRKRVRVLPPSARAPRSAKKGTRRVYITELWIEEKGNGLCLVRARILRGFRHQIRAHLAHLGLPILGDALYGTEPAGGGGEARMRLHAEMLEFRHPVSGEPVLVRSDPPKCFLEEF
jgi:23S rRNA pseudouridine1911/1915/1917 synthase